MDKNDILNYVTETPGNTNRAVLSGMLDSMSGGGESEMFMVTITPDSHIGSVTSGTMDKTYDEIVEANESGKFIFAFIRIGNGGGPDARMIPLAYDGYSAFRGSSTVYYYGASEVYELEIRISSSSCNVTGRAI